MDKKLKAECVALLLLFAAFPLTSLGKMGNTNLLWWLGLLCLVLGGLLPVATRYMSHIEDALRDMGIEFDDRVS
jgi:hypothetical protein